MFNLGMSELVIILVIALVVFGPSRLPEIGRAVGKSFKGFKDATNDVKNEVHNAVALDVPNKEPNK